jgi:4-nitrophenyl phosphatase/NagD protein
MDGTFYLGNKLLPGALQFMSYLAATGRDYLFLTNNSSRNAAHYAHKLASLGWWATPDDVLTSGEATALYIRQLHPGARLYVVGTPDLRQELAAYGFTLTDNQPDYVVLGFDTTLTYDKLVTACDLIRHGTPFIATHPDLNCPTETGFIPDCGSMLALIKASTGAEPKVIGKPNREIIDVIFTKKCFAQHEMAIVGDRLYTDIATGRNAGIASMLVLSGETKREDLVDSLVQPDYIFENLGDLAEHIAIQDQAISLNES